MLLVQVSSVLSPEEVLPPVQTALLPAPVLLVIATKNAVSMPAWHQLLNKANLGKVG